MTLYTIKKRRGTASFWASLNPVLYDGQWGVELDTGKVKLGDGTTAWNALPYFVTSDLSPIGPSYVLLEPGEGAPNVPEDTPDGTPILRKVIPTPEPGPDPL